MSHEVVNVTRSRGADVVTGEGLDQALHGVEVVVDTTTLVASDAAAAAELFGQATSNLLAAERRAGVRHHVLLSIVGVDRITGNAHYAGKRAQERLVQEGAVPFTIQRATQFHDFPATVVSWLRKEDTVRLPPALLQPVATSEVGQVLAEIAVGQAQGRAQDLGGPETEDMVDMARRTLTARGEKIRIIPTWQETIMSLEAAGEVLLPGANARLGKITFEAWLEGGGG